MAINTSAQTKRRIRNRKILESQKVKDEPNIVEQERDLGNALSWYSANTNSKEQKQYTLEYFNEVDKEVAKQLKKLEEWNFGTFGSICRLMSRGMYDPSLSTSTWFEKKKAELLVRASKKIEEVKVTQQKVEKPVLTIQQRIFNAASDIAGEIDEQIDKFTTNGYTQTDFQTKNFLLQQSVSAPVARKVADWFIPIRDELQGAYDKTDEQLVEGYSHITRRELKRFLDFVKDIVSACEQQVQRGKASRAPRKRKPVAPAKMVARVKYQKEFSELNLKSIAPVKMVGVNEIWCYNTKYKKIIRYTSDDILGIKGTTIVGFDVAKSQQWTLRKPNEFFKGLVIGKRPLNAAVKEIKTKPTTPNGRINENCILLGAF